MNWGIRVLQTHALPLGYGASYNHYINFFLKRNCFRNKILPPVFGGKIFLIGAEDEIRTRDVHLGKVTLYH